MFEDELERSHKGRLEGTEIRMVAALPDERIAGIFALSQIFLRSFQSAYAGWRVSADQLGRGIATLGVIALLDLAFMPDYLRIDGVWQDHLMFAKLADEHTRRFLLDAS